MGKKFDLIRSINLASNSDSFGHRSLLTKTMTSQFQDTSMAKLNYSNNAQKMHLKNLIKVHSKVTDSLNYHQNLQKRVAWNQSRKL